MKEKDRYEILAVISYSIGLTLVIGGFWWVYPPMALIIGGVLFLVYGFGSYLAGRDEEKKERVKEDESEGTNRDITKE